MSKYDYIEHNVENRIALITLDRPEKRNAMSIGLIEEMVEALRRAEENEEIRTAIITGKGAAFSAGWDLEETGGTDTSMEVPSVDSWLERFEHSTEHLDTIYDVDIPVIAAVNGYAVAGGLNLAAYCDITIASEDATFSAQAIRMGGYSPTPILPYYATTQKRVRELWFTGKNFDAEEAKEIGIVNHTVPHAELMDEAFEIAEMVKKVPGYTITLQKRMLNGMLEIQGYSASRRAGSYLDAVAHSTDDGKEFFRIREEEGVQAAVRWMTEADKD